MQDRESKGLLQLLTVTEDLLFSFPLPSDIVKKYEFLRAGVFAKLDWQHDFSKAWRMQREAHGRVATDKTAAQTKEMCEELLQCVTNYHSTCTRYKQSLETLVNSLSSDHSQIKARFSGGRESAPPKLRKYEAVELPTIDAGDLAALGRQCQLFLDAQQREEADSLRLTKDVEGRQTESHLMSEQMLAMLAEQEACVKALELELKTENAAKKAAEDRVTLSLKQGQEQLKALESDLRLEFENELVQEQERIQSEHDEEIRQIRPQLASEMESLNANLRHEIETLKLQHSEAEKAHNSTESQLHSRLQQLSEEDSEMLRDLRERLEKAEVRDTVFRDVLRAVFEKAHLIYKKFAVSNGEWTAEMKKRREAVERQLGAEAEQYVDQLLEVDFLTFFVQKLDSDNRWLAEKLAELNQENEKLKRYSPAPADLHKQIWADVQQSASALKEFEQARNKLLQQFQDKGTALRSEDF